MLAVALYILLVIFLWEIYAIPFLKSQGLYGTPSQHETVDELRSQEQALFPASLTGKELAVVIYDTESSDDCLC